MNKLDRSSFEDLYYYMVYQMKQALRRAGLQDTAGADIVQNIWLKFVERVIRGENIRSPKAYIWRMIEHEIANFRRDTQQELNTVIPLPENEHGELFEGRMQIIASKGMADPLEEFEKEQLEKFRMRDLVQAILALPPRQRYAMLLRLQPVADEVYELDLAFQEAGVNLTEIKPPDSLEEKHRLVSLTVVAQKNLRRFIEDGYRAPDNVKQLAIDELVPQATNATRGSLRPSGTAIVQSPDPDSKRANLLIHMDVLKEPYQTVMRLRYVEKLSIIQVAERLQVPVGTVKSYISRGFHTLRIYEHVQNEGNKDVRVAYNNFLDAVEKRLDQLREPYQTVIRLRFLENCSNVEIASKLGRPGSTIKSQVHRGLLLLGLECPSVLSRMEKRNK